MTHRPAWLRALAAVVLLVPAVATAGGTTPLDSGVEHAVAEAVAHLWRAHQDDRWPESFPGALPHEYGSRTALAVYALLLSGQSHQAEPMARTIEWLCALDTDSVYVRSLRVLALAEVPTQPSASHVAETLAADVRWLRSAARPDGAYDYGPAETHTRSWDNANTFMAHLAVSAGARRGAAVPEEYWRLAEHHWRRTQTGRGGWAYASDRKPAYGSVTAGALASLLHCYDTLHRDAALRPGADDAWASIQRGLDWIAEHFNPWENPGRGPQEYFAYIWALERIGAMGGFKQLGSRDWFAEITAELLRMQRPDGGWGELGDTCLAVAFLAHGRTPVLVSKLAYDGLWNPRPRDMANLTQWLSDLFEQPIRWQVLSIEAPVEQWCDAPILYISGTALPPFTDDQIERLRAFVARGGLLLSDAADSSPAFNIAMRKVYQTLFPDRAFDTLDPAHPLWTAHGPVDHPPRLRAVSNGVRLLAVHSPTDLSKAWHMRRTDVRADAFQLGANLYVHATDFGESPGRSAPFAWSGPAETDEDQAVDRTIHVARLAHEGNGDPEPMAYVRLARLMARHHAIGLRIDPPVPIADLPAADHPIALMTGTERFTLAPEDRRALRAFISAGGLLVVDAAGGREAFADAAREHLLPLLDDAYPRVGRLSPQSPIYRRQGLEIDTVQYRRASRARYGQDREPQLEAVIVGDRPAIIFSSEDLTAGLVGYLRHDLHGYAPASAWELMRNLLLYAADRPKPDKPLLQGFINVQWEPTESGPPDE